MFADPTSNLKQLGLEENMIVADLGAGTGFYTVAAAHLVPRGKVYAVEVQKDYLPTIKEKAHTARLNNVECLWGNIEKNHGTKIGDRVADAVVASNVLFQVEDRNGFISEIYRILKPGGKVLLVDWSGASALGPNSAHLVSKNTAEELFQAKGFKVEREIPAGEHHYGMILRKER